MTPQIDGRDFASSPEYFSDMAISSVVREWARTMPDRPAFSTAESVTTWGEYDALAEQLAAALESGSASGVAILLPDTAPFHAALCASYRVGRIATGVGFRSGVREIAHLVRAAGCGTLITTPAHRGVEVAELVLALHGGGAAPADVVVVEESGPAECRVRRYAVDAATGRLRPASAAGLGAESRGRPKVFNTSEVTMLNSTSGTTGLPKVVAHTERKWVEFARIGMLGADIDSSDVFCSAVPAPFGFGLWTAHFLPALLGAKTVVMARFDVDAMVELIERERVTVLCCVSTQFKMLLRSERARTADLSSLRVLYTGGEAVPYSEAVAFEQRTGAVVLQFYGSNEAGGVSHTTIADDEDTRLRTCGHVIASMNVRVLDDAGAVVRGAAGTVRRGQPAVHGPLESAGYWHDEEANAELYTDDGWLLLGDIVEIDESDRVRVVGRRADIIIRGGKNVSATDIEELVRGHPAVQFVSVVGVPDEIFGERVCAVIVPVDGPAGGPVTTDALRQWMAGQGVTAEYIPEYVVTVAALPLAPGGKVAKGEVRELAAAQLGRASG